VHHGRSRQLDARRRLVGAVGRAELDAVADAGTDHRVAEDPGAEAHASILVAPSLSNLALAQARVTDSL